MVRFAPVYAQAFPPRGKPRKQQPWRGRTSLRSVRTRLSCLSVQVADAATEAGYEAHHLAHVDTPISNPRLPQQRSNLPQQLSNSRMLSLKPHRNSLQARRRSGNSGIR